MRRRQRLGDGAVAIAPAVLHQESVRGDLQRVLRRVAREDHGHAHLLRQRPDRRDHHGLVAIIEG